MKIRFWTKSILVLAWLGACLAAMAQDEGPNLKPKKPKPSVATLLVVCDLACDWKLDGDAMGRIEAGASVKAKVELGQHVVNATTIDGLDKVEKDVEIESTAQKVVRVELQPVRDARIKLKHEAPDTSTAGRQPSQPEPRSQPIAPPAPPNPDIQKLSTLLESIKPDLMAPGPDYPGGGSWRTKKVETDPLGCRFRVTKIYRRPQTGIEQERESTYFLDTINTVDVLDGQGVYVDHWHEPDTTQDLFDFLRTGDTQSANRVAEALRSATQICHSRITPVGPTIGEASLATTLRFISDELPDAGAVDYSQRMNGGGSTKAGVWFKRSVRISEAGASPGDVCELLYTKKETVNGSALAYPDGTPRSADVRYRIPLRHIERIYAASLQDDRNLHAGGPLDLVGKFETDVPVFVLRIKYLSAESAWTDLILRDQGLANRLAEAMSHAAKLCGGATETRAHSK